MSAPPEPDPFVHTFTNLVAARALIGATEIGVFDALAGAEATPAELAQRLELDPLGAETLATTRPRRSATSSAPVAGACATARPQAGCS